MREKKKSHLAQQMMDLVAEYRKRFGVNEVTIGEVGVWAIDEGLYDLSPEGKLDQFKMQMRRVMQSDEVMAPNGEWMRRNLPVPEMVDGKQQFLWGDITTAAYDFVSRAFEYQRRCIRKDVEKSKKNLRIYNEFYKPAGVPPLDFDWDFNNEPTDLFDDGETDDDDADF